MARKPYEPRRCSRKLAKYFDQINAEYFGGMVCGGIGWRYMHTNSDTCTQAVAEFAERFIKVNVVLDDRRVPVWYLKFVIYHEMLHLSLGYETDDNNKTVCYHSARFKSLERRHPDYSKAIAWEDKNLDRIAKSWKKWREWHRKQGQ